MSLGDLFPLIDFGGIFAFILVNLAVIVYFFGRKKERSGSRRFQIFGRSRLRIFGLYCRLAESFRYGKDHRVHLVGCVGFVYMLIWTKGFKRKMKPIENIAEDNNDVNSSEISETKVPLQ